jgi:hypothetical protein
MLPKVNHRVDQSEYVDTGIGSIQDGYSPEELINISMYYLTNDKPRSGNGSWRDRMTFLVNHMMILCGENMRNASLQHMFCQILERETFMHCPALVFMFDSSKTNQDHQKQYSGAVGNKDVRICALGAAALYFFWRYYMGMETFPDFRSHDKWYDIKVLKSSNHKNKDSKMPISYDAQRKSVTNVFDAVGVHSTTKTHSQRDSGARHAEVLGATEDQLRRMAHWQPGSMEKSYLTGLPTDAIKLVNGFNQEGQHFWIPRGTVVPSLELQGLIFPEVDRWLARLEDPVDTECPKSLSALGFLTMLKEFWPVILQDEACKYHKRFSLPPKKKSNSLFVPVIIENITTYSLIDSGSSFSMITPEFFNSLVPPIPLVKQEGTIQLGHVDNAINRIGS